MKPKPTRRARARARARKFLAAMQREYARAEKRLIAAALVGCLRPDPNEPNRSEASSSGRSVDVSREVNRLRWDRNHVTMAERDLRYVERVEKAAAKKIRAERKRMTRKAK